MSRYFKKNKIKPVKSRTDRMIFLYSRKVTSNTLQQLQLDSHNAPPIWRTFSLLLVLWPHPLSLLGQIFVYQFDQLRHLQSRRVKMAAFTVARSSRGLFNGLRVSFGSLTLPKHGALSAAVLKRNLLWQCRWYSVSHMSVKERIDKKRKAALVGGGQNRIDAQHKRVIIVEHSKSVHLLFKVSI